MISIIVPVYNAEKYLNRCIDSILKQTFTDLEIILVDDGSTDDSLKICEEYQKQDDRIIVIHKDNRGSTSARKAGVRIAKGAYIAFVDSDDWLELEMYETLYNIHLKYGGDIISCKPRMHCIIKRRCIRLISWHRGV